MWVLEADGDIFNGKRLWLRPGKRFLLGRTATETGQVTLSHPSVSRRHLTIEVGEVTSKDCPSLKARSQVVVEDLKTKHGTTVNGEQIRGTRYVLQKDTNDITLSRCEHKLRITWVPVTFTFSFTLKEAKADPYTALYETLGPLDIKVLIDFQREATTHVVAKSRNTSKGLQALINGRFIVGIEKYVDAVVAAATPVIPTETDGQVKSLLEQDWDAHFPNPAEYLPPRGGEPTERDDSSYAPNLDRQNVFEGYTFIFYEKKQFDTLLAPINDGGGKAYFRQVIQHETEVQDFVRYVKGVAGEKGLGEFEDGSEGKGVVIVRYNPVKNPGIDWFAEFGRQVALALDHRLIEQNEFLDAILANDASGLRRPLELEPPGTMEPTPSAETTTSHTFQASQASQASVDPIRTPAESSQPEPVRRGRSRRTVARRFKGFDDDDDDDVVKLDSIPEAPIAEPAPAEESQGLFVSQDPELEAEYHAHQTRATRTRSSRKRVTPPVEYEPEKQAPIEEEEEDFVDKLAPTAAALKRRRLAEQTARRRRGESSPPPESVKESPEPELEPAKKVKKEVDILELARTKREEAEELARREREALQEALHGMDIEAIRNLTIIEELEISRQPPPQRPSRDYESNRWDDRWNGRKNFKKFRRRGETGGRARDFHRVIVPLEEVKKKDFGIGDDYWLETDSQKRNKKDKGQGSQDTLPSQSRRNAGGSSRPPETAPLELDDEPESDAVVLASSDVEVLEEPPPPARSSRTQQKSQKTAASAAPSQTRAAAANGKRPAPASFAKPAPAKKTRHTPARRKDDSDDSDDELKFRFRR